MTAAPMSRRAVGRATLARQLLLDRAEMPALDAVEHLVGMQAQLPNPPYVGLWTRLRDFDFDELARLYLDRQVVRVVVMRSTIHLVSARDCLPLRQLVQPALTQGLRHAYGRYLTDVDVDAVVAAGRELVDAAPMTYAQLGDALGQRWPQHDSAALAHAVRSLTPLVQVTPRGLWGKSGPLAHTTAENWLGTAGSDAGFSIDDLVLRYLAAFGPASVKDMQNWSGLTRLKEVFERLRSSLCVARAEPGVELFDLPQAPRPDEDVPAPVRFLPEWDNLLLSHADRTRVMSEEHRKRLFASPNGIIPGSILVDGMATGSWKVRRDGDAAVLVIDAYSPLDAAARAALAEEGGRLLDAVASDAGTHDVEFIGARR